MPKAVREALGAGRGDDLVFQVEESGVVYVTGERRRTLSELAGILSRTPTSHAPGKEEEIAALEATERDRHVVRDHSHRRDSHRLHRGQGEEEE